MPRAEVRARRREAAQARNNQLEDGYADQFSSGLTPEQEEHRKQILAHQLTQQYLARSHPISFGLGTAFLNRLPVIGFILLTWTVLSSLQYLIHHTLALVFVVGLFLVVALWALQHSFNILGRLPSPFLRFISDGSCVFNGLEVYLPMTLVCIS